ncbi:MULTISPECIES: type I-E CRISPR-associated protein Cas6/Cse3/CasE [Actinosynnema]|uniref:type I-E CRISPR-associated protein Cas6/Cse3/CasE n=1 Tax=Actinosynnema TaxID=40566 RepID=UPI0020A2ACE4|nr:type I-E CRISPR-associated protein Cas6/Cse3/CasE [Actinosynnema pretiosum]MCP2098891.1 CRISPR system Cascade subunit CasE [Actinosynnema pretiosum]
MHLSRFEVNTARRAARALLASPQELHAGVMAAFTPAASAPERGRVLWRVDHHQHRTVLFVVSPHRPDLTHLVERVGWPSTRTWDTRDYRPLLDRLAARQTWAFRLKANPTRSIRRTPGSARTQRFGHVTAGQQTTWLLDRAERHGFTVPLGEQEEPDVAVRERELVVFQGRGGNVTLATAVFEGHLTVTDPDALRAVLAEGLGAAKGYGCGLLTLAPVRRS